MEPAVFQYVTGCIYQCMLAAEAKRQLFAMIDMRNPSRCHQARPACNDGTRNGRWLHTLYLQVLQHKYLQITFGFLTMLLFSDKNY